MKSHGDAVSMPDLLLERYRLNEVSPAEKDDIERRLREEAPLRERLADLERSDAEIRATDFTASLATRVERRAAADKARARASSGTATGALRWALPLALGVTAMLVVIVGSRLGGVRPDAGEDTVKGLHPSLSMFRWTPKGSEQLADKSRAREGDVVLLAYQSAGQTYGVIVSIDGRGGVTVHLPPAGRMAARLQAGDKVLLDHAYELDDAPRWECFYFVTAQGPFDVQPIVDAATREASLHPASPPPALPVSHPGLQQSRFVLQKERKP